MSLSRYDPPYRISRDWPAARELIVDLGCDAGVLKICREGKFHDADVSGMHAGSTEIVQRGALFRGDASQRLVQLRELLDGRTWIDCHVAQRCQTLQIGAGVETLEVPSPLIAQLVHPPPLGSETYPA
jgi:hypothetical protein